MATTFLEALHSGRVLLMDGAMGTELQRAGMQTGECYEHWNLTHPDRILAIHRAYVDAGAEVLLTNTFQANPVALAKHGIADKLDDLCSAAIHLARNEISEFGFVLGDIGAWEGYLADGSKAALAVMAWALDKCDGLLLETLSDPNPVGFLPNIWFHDRRIELRVALVSCTFCRNPSRELRTFEGFSPEAIARRAAKRSVAALGVNCGRDITMDDCSEIIRRYRTVTDLPLFARPNAGTPTKIDGQWVYPRTPEQMAAELPKLLEAGVSMVGGCCGTTPAHIAAFRHVIDDWNAKKETART